MYTITTLLEVKMFLKKQDKQYLFSIEIVGAFS